jgi:hypothetical protein
MFIGSSSSHSFLAEADIVGAQNIIRRRNMLEAMHIVLRLIDLDDCRDILDALSSG